MFLFYLQIIIHICPTLIYSHANTVRDLYIMITCFI